MNVKLGLLAVSGLVGCASTGRGQGEPDFSGFARRDVPSVLVGEARVLDEKVNPLAPLRVEATQAGGVTVRFGRPGHAGALASLDPSSLNLVAVEERPAGEDFPRPPPDAARVQLDGGRFIVCWKRGTAESGYRALAQEYKQDGTPVGAPSVISPPDVDVMGVPQVVSPDGRHVVATFAVSAEKSFELLAVPIEGARSAASEDALTARR